MIKPMIFKWKSKWFCVVEPLFYFILWPNLTNSFLLHSVPVVTSLMWEFWMVSMRSADLALKWRGPCFSSAWRVRESGPSTLRPPIPAHCRTVHSVLHSSAIQKSLTHTAQREDVPTLGPVQGASSCLHTMEKAVPTSSALIVAHPSAFAVSVWGALGWWILKPIFLSIDYPFFKVMI